MSGSSASAQSAPPPTESSTEQSGGQKFWEFADLGFDTQKQLWFMQFYNAINENVGTYFAKRINISGGWAAQYQWKDSQGGPFWHVRERLYATQVERLSMEPGGAAIDLVFKEEGVLEGEGENAPTDFAYLLYAYHLTSKGAGRAPMGFVEFYDSEGSPVGKVENRWILVEGARRKTFGEYPGIRIRVERSDIATVTVSGTAIIIKGKPGKVA